MSTQTSAHANQTVAAAAPPRTANFLQRKCACGGSAGFSGQCEDCGKNRLGIQRRAASPDAGIAPPIVHEVLRSPGVPLDPALRADLEPRFGHDFSRVRVHTDARAAQSADAVSAHAYTVGRDVVFASGQYVPHSAAGKKLLAHELTHVLQQHHGMSANGPTQVSSPADPAEREAEKIADSVSVGSQDNVAVRTESAFRVARQQVPQAAEKGGVPCVRDAYKVFERKVDLQPVFFRDSDTDKSPTGGSWARRLTSANSIWGKLGVVFNALSAIVRTDAANKTAAVASDADFLALVGMVDGAGVEVFLLDNPIASRGGAGTSSAGTSGAKIVMSDGGTSDTLLAHELGHALLGVSHPPAGGDSNTIMEPSNSRDAANPTRNTIGNYNRITWPAPGNILCIRPDP